VRRPVQRDQPGERQLLRADQPGARHPDHRVLRQQERRRLVQPAQVLTPGARVRAARPPRGTARGRVSPVRGRPGPVRASEGGRGEPEGTGGLSLVPHRRRTSAGHGGRRTAHPGHSRAAVPVPPVSEGYAVTVPEGYRIGVWEVREPIATGAFGSVYAARRADGGDARPRTAALKFLPTGTATPRQVSHLRDLAEREVELLRRLRRPRLIRMYETLVVDDPGHPALDGATVLVL